MPDTQLYEDIGSIKTMLQVMDTRLTAQEKALIEVKTLVTNWKVGFGLLLTVGSVGLAAILAWGNIVAFFTWVHGLFATVPLAPK